jgi:nicotinamide-nucleotide amidase
MINDALYAQAEDVVTRASEKRIKIAVAESCTGGLLGGALTAISGSSAVFDRGFVTYTNDAKEEMLGVLAANLNFPGPGAVSEVVAKEMATGALKHSNASIAVSITGIAGPNSDDTEKPVGLVYLGLALKGQPVESHKCQFDGLDRAGVRQASVIYALDLLGDAVERLDLG